MRPKDVEEEHKNYTHERDSGSGEDQCEGDEPSQPFEVSTTRDIADGFRQSADEAGPYDERCKQRMGQGRGRNGDPAIEHRKLKGLHRYHR